MFCVATIRQRPSILRTTRVPMLSATAWLSASCKTSPSIQKRVCRIAMSGVRKCTCISGDLRVLDRNGPFAPCRRCIRSRNPCAARGPGAVDGDELRVVRERLGDALGIVRVPRRVEAVFELANLVFVRRTYWVSLFRRRRARSGPVQFSFTPDCSMICLNREASLRMRSARASRLTGEASCQAR